jgi:histidine ammonia-lyase
MGVHAADKLQRIVDNVRNVLAIELLCAAQGVDLRAPHRPGPALDDAHRTLRQAVPHLTIDRPVYRDVERVRALLDDGAIVAAVRRHVALE